MPPRHLHSEGTTPCDTVRLRAPVPAPPWCGGRAARAVSFAPALRMAALHPDRPNLIDAGLLGPRLLLVHDSARSVGSASPSTGQELPKRQFRDRPTLIERDFWLLGAKQPDELVKSYGRYIEKIFNLADQPLYAILDHCSTGFSAKGTFVTLPSCETTAYGPDVISLGRAPLPYPGIVRICLPR